ncbi:hypothetical protein NADFUDRAFT_83487 [Nadsonia fulvescens var. elongata DSM 6958]|uniref:Uncharacterized protein n=1 Tax=Nadsonia fulvescens var. elongata DSM 6958 TaxID=857566 RepID=A0A1E3PH02_9ASCO|nr:hypothetical protein NADFUDRAFT_83487 [Nadsonia fulvescens var. elongata DSM 6958]
MSLSLETALIEKLNTPEIIASELSTMSGDAVISTPAIKEDNSNGDEVSMLASTTTRLTSTFNTVDRLSQSLKLDGIDRIVVFHEGNEINGGNVNNEFTMVQSRINDPASEAIEDSLVSTVIGKTASTAFVADEALRKAGQKILSI